MFPKIRGFFLESGRERNTIADVERKNRTRLSVVAVQTKNMLLYLLVGIAVVLGAIYLFLMNHIAFQGYVFQNQSDRNQELLGEVSYLDTKIARIQTAENLEKIVKKHYPMVSRDRDRFVIIQSGVTAKR